MAVRWTTEQQQVIDARHSNLLVSAAAGSSVSFLQAARLMTSTRTSSKASNLFALIVVFLQLSFIFPADFAALAQLDVEAVFAACNAPARMTESEGVAG